MSTSPRRALIVVDVQNEYVTGELPIEYPPVQESLANICLAIDTAHAHAVPVIVVQHLEAPGASMFARGSHGAALHPVVASRAYDHLIEKTLPSSFAGTDLADWLARQEIDTLSVVGYMTHNCNFSTVLHASHAGMNVEYLNDATGAVPYENDAGYASAQDIHHAFTVVMHARFAAVVRTDDWIAALHAGKRIERGSIGASNRKARERAIERHESVGRC
jgi:nicotinamidase-related amidase